MVKTAWCKFAMGVLVRGVNLKRIKLILVKLVRKVVEGAGFEPAKAEPSDLQSDPFGRSGTPPH